MKLRCCCWTCSVAWLLGKPLQDDEDDNIEDGKGLGAIQSSAKPLGHGGCKVLLPLRWTFPSWWSPRIKIPIVKLCVSVFAYVHLWHKFCVFQLCSKLYFFWCISCILVEAGAAKGESVTLADCLLHASFSFIILHTSVLGRLIFYWLVKNKHLIFQFSKGLTQVRLYEILNFTIWGFQ